MLKKIEELRKERDIPVLFLSGLGKLEDRLKGLSAGGDDYLPKPYDIDELMMRIKAILHRSKRFPKTLVKGLLTLDTVSCNIYLSSVELKIRRKEFDVLFLLVQNENKVFSPEQIYEQVWGKKMLDDNRTVRATIRDLRKSLEGSGYTINTIRGNGYVFEKVK